MKLRMPVTALLLCTGLTAVAQDLDQPPPDGPGRIERIDHGMPPNFKKQTDLVKRFDKDGDKRLNAAERKAAREYLQQERAQNPGPRGRGPRRMVENQEPPQPGPKVAPAEVKSFPDAALYDPKVVRTIFLQFEDADWEKELEEFKNTDVEVPATLTVDGKVYKDIGVHFRGMSSFMMVGEGRKRSLNLSLDFVHKNQQVGGYRTLNLLNSHEDPTFLRTVLYSQIAREYLPAPKANFVRVVINGESWGIYVNTEQFNKDFVKEWFGTTKGRRWKVPGSPNGQGSLAYLGDDAEAYRSIYTIKTKDQPKAWADLIKLCKVLNETPSEKLEAALTPLLDIEGALKFLALENVFINNDGYWIRTSDYDIYQEENGRFHILPQDINETFSRPEGPGFGGGPGGFGPAGILASQMFSQADRNHDQKLARDELFALADTWFNKLDSKKTGKLSENQFTSRLGDILAMPEGMRLRLPKRALPDDRNGPEGESRDFGPMPFLGLNLFKAVDGNADGFLTRAELKQTFAKWFGKWDADKRGFLNEDSMRQGLNDVFPPPRFPGGARGRGGPGPVNVINVKGVELDPLIAANDPNKPLLSKLLAVPSLRARYLGYVREIAEKWLDWKTLGPFATEYHSLIAADVKADTRKLDSAEDFDKGLTEDIPGRGGGPGGRGTIGLKNFMEQRRAFLLQGTPGSRAQASGNADR